MPLTALTLSFECDQTSRNSMTVVGSDSAPVIYQANVTTIRASLFNGTPATGTFVADISNVTSARLLIRKNHPGGTVLIDKTATLDGTTAYSTWANGTKQHFSFALSAVETNQTLPSDGTLDIYGVIEIVTSTGPIAIGHFNGNISYDGITGVGAPTLPVTGIPFTALNFTSSNLTSIATRNFSDLQNNPTTLAGYGITDALTSVPAARVIYVSSAGSDSTGAAGDVAKPSLTISNAVALASALTPTESSPVLIRVWPGTFTENSTFTLPAYVSLVGSGMDVTIIESSFNTITTGGIKAIVGLGTNSVVFHLTVKGTASSGTQLPIGGTRNQPDFTNATIAYVKTSADTDGLYIRGTTASSLRAFNCVFLSKFDAVNIIDNATVDAYDCVAIVTGPSSVLAGGQSLSRGVVASGFSAGIGGTVRWYGGSVSVTGATGGSSSRNVIFESGGSLSSATSSLTAVNTLTTLGSTATVNYDLNTTASSSTLSYSNLTKSSGAAVVTNGSNITNLGLAIGRDVQAWDTDLTTWAGITPGTGVGTALGVNVGSAGALGRQVGVPSTASSTGTAGDYSYDASFFYICTASNTWKRVGIATWP